MLSSLLYHLLWLRGWIQDVDGTILPLAMSCNMRPILAPTHAHRLPGTAAHRCRAGAPHVEIQRNTPPTRVPVAAAKE